LIKAAEASIITRVANRVYEEELEQDIAPSFGMLEFPPNGLFIRLDGCSAKDGAKGAKVCNYLNFNSEACLEFCFVDHG
jgi:hypothetical protein